MTDPDLANIQERALAEIRAAATLAELEAARVAHTGRRSPLAETLAGIGGLPPDRRGVVGKAANLARRAVEEALAARTEELEAEEMGAALERDATDVTLPGDPHPLGALHPITQVRQEMEDILLALGYRIADGPEVETEWHNFTALNTPAGHPARSPSDTFFIDGRPDRMLRTQTSPVQVREMQQSEPPIYLVAPGRGLPPRRHRRHPQPDVPPDGGPGGGRGPHAWPTSRARCSTSSASCSASEREILLQPHFFPFTEPSVDVQVSYIDKNGRPAWLELAGAGMVDPNVLESCGIDSERYTGFAFGCGLDRIAMIRFGVPDLRLFFENDLRFLEQFA